MHKHQTKYEKRSKITHQHQPLLPYYISILLPELIELKYYYYYMKKFNMCLDWSVWVATSNGYAEWNYSAFLNVPVYKSNIEDADDTSTFSNDLDESVIVLCQCKANSGQKWKLKSQSVPLGCNLSVDAFYSDIIILRR